MELAVAALTQVVFWPLAALLVWRAASGRVSPAGWVVAVMLAACAVSAWDPASELVFSRVAVAIINSSIALLFAIYPDGRFVPRWIIVPALIEIAIQAANAASGFALEELQPWWALHMAIIWVVLLIGGQVYRYRLRSSVDERERTRWPLLAVITMIVAFAVWSFVTLGLAVDMLDGSGTWFANLLLILPGMGFAIGLLAPRVVPVDRALRWVIQWGSWAIVVTGTAWGAAAMLSNADPAPRAWSAAVITAAVAVPSAWLARRTADAVVYGRRADPLRTLEELGLRLSAAVDPRSVPSDIVRTVTGSLGLSYAELRGAAALAARSGIEPAAAAIAEYPIRYQGELLATLRVAPRPGDAALTAHDRAVLTQIGAQAAPALHSVRVVDDLIEARARVVRAREEERKRLRRDLHDELAPTFAGLGLSAAAVEVFSRVGDDRAGDAAADLVAGLHAATRQLRDVAYDLRPPVLDDRGLAAAVRERVVVAGVLPTVRVEAPPERLALPAAVESAALRIAQEAVMNVRRHAAASLCTVSIARIDDDLVIEIADDGVGVSGGAKRGLGLQSMSERAAELGGTLTISERPGGGTSVRAVLPLASAPQPEAVPA